VPSSGARTKRERGCWLVHEGQRHLLGIEGAKSHVLGVRATYRDLHLTIERQIAEGEGVVSCIRVRGVHAGEWAGIRPTGKLLTFTGVNVNRVVGGRIVEHGGAANLLGPLLASGAISIT
jgi:predicted ester cyclase